MKIYCGRGAGGWRGVGGRGSHQVSLRGAGEGGQEEAGISGQGEREEETLYSWVLKAE